MQAVYYTNLTSGRLSSPNLIRGRETAPFFSMPTTVKDYMDAIDRVRKAIPSEVGEILARNEQKVLDLNRKLQLFEKGENIFGKVVGVYRNDIEMSLFSDPAGYPKRAGQHINFFDTSDLYRNFTFEYRDNKLYIYSEDIKSSELVLRYGDIFGLNKENQVTLNEEIIKPELWDYIRIWL